MRYLVFDMSNILHKTFYAHNTDDDINEAGIAAHSALLTLNKYFNLFKPDKIIMAFDRPSWRIDYTKSEKCISGKLYKGGRRKNQTESQKERYQMFRQHINDFEKLVSDKTSAITLAAPKLEADDLIAGCVQILTDSDDRNEIIIISADKDFMQLLRYDNVHLIDPATGDERTLADHNNDPEYFIFEKCIRGEGENGDNVQSAKPRIRKDKIKEAYEDDYARQNLMNDTWNCPKTGKTFRVGDLFKENEKLMDLERQPKKIALKILRVVQEGLDNPGTFNHFHFIKFCNKYDLKRVKEGSDNYIKMLSL